MKKAIKIILALFFLILFVAPLFVSAQDASRLQIAPSKSAASQLQTKASLHITNPTDSTVLISGEECQVQWTSTGNIPSVNIWMEYIDRKNQITVMQLPGIGNKQVPNSGTYTINIPANWNSNQGARWRLKLQSGNIIARSGVLNISQQTAGKPSQKTMGAQSLQQQKAGKPSQQVMGTEASQHQPGGQTSQQQTQQSGGPTQTGSARLQVLWPNGGEELISEHEYELRWQSTGDPGPLTLTYSEHRGRQINIARNVPNTGVYKWRALRPRGPISLGKLVIQGANARDESDNLFTIAPYIDLVAPEITVYNKKKKQNWFLRSLKAVASAGMSEIKESVDHIKDDKDGDGPNLRRKDPIEIRFAVMQWGTRQINEKVLTTITIKQLPNNIPVEVMACEAQLKTKLQFYECKKSFKADGPLFTPGKYLIEVWVDPNKRIPEEDIFRDNNRKTIEFELVESQGGGGKGTLK